MLHVVVALRPEASPLLDAWSLRRRPEARGVELYEGDLDGLPVRLVRAGIGKASVASAVGWLAGLEDSKNPAIWLDVGIAGHGTRPAGTALLAHRVVDVATGRASYPPLVFEPPCATCEVRTVDLVETEFSGDVSDAAFDMEASAFVDAARRFAPAELVHCLKIVSDGPGTDLATLTRERIADLVAGAVGTVDEVVARLRPVLAEAARMDGVPADLAELLASKHWSASDRVELRKLLRRRQALAPDDALPAEVTGARRGRDANRALRVWLAGLALRRIGTPRSADSETEMEAAP